jgi:hypothetical protein
MKTTDKKIKVEFAPGAFDDFEGTQEELDQLQEELLMLFSELSPEELAMRSSPVDLEALSDEDPEVAEKIVNFLGDDAPRVLQ